MRLAPIPVIPWWAAVVAAALAVVLILKHVQWLLFLPVVLFVLWEIAHNAQASLLGLTGDRAGVPGPLRLMTATLLGLALLVSGWWLLTLVYAGSWAARWYATGRGRRR